MPWLFFGDNIETGVGGDTTVGGRLASKYKIRPVLKAGLPPFARELGEMAARFLESQLTSEPHLFNIAERYTVTITLKVTGGRYAETLSIKIK